MVVRKQHLLLTLTMSISTILQKPAGCWSNIYIHSLDVRTTITAPQITTIETDIVRANERITKLEEMVTTLFEQFKLIQHNREPLTKPSQFEKVVSNKIFEKIIDVQKNCTVCHKSINMQESHHVRPNGMLVHSNCYIDLFINPRRIVEKIPIPYNLETTITDHCDNTNKQLFPENMVSFYIVLASHNAEFNKSFYAASNKMGIPKEARKGFKPHISIFNVYIDMKHPDAKMIATLNPGTP